MDAPTTAALDLIDEERHMLVGDRPALHHRCYVWGCTMPALHIEAYAVLVQERRLSDLVWGTCDGHFLDTVEAIAFPARPRQGAYPWPPVL